ncbi:DUF551 domain-containing protein [Klebsiella pneumoniae]|nr:DUF551 domain-containing protein [Klebsiella pneumoniae]
MTKSTITDERITSVIERLEHYACNLKWTNFRGAQDLLTAADGLRELQERRKAEMDSEPVILYRQVNPVNGMKTYWAELDPEEFRHLKQHTDENAEFMTLYRHAQPAPVVPDVMEPTIEAIKRILPTSNPDEYAACIGADMWNTCRSAMLQELKKSAGTEATCRSDENVQVLHTKSPAQSDCCPAQNHVSPEQNGDTPAQSQGWIPVSERMPPSRYEVLVGRWWGEKPRWCCKWATYIPGHPDAQSSGWLIPGASWTPTHWMPLPAAPQEVR